MEALYRGRAFLAVGSGEAMNEVSAGMKWPGVAEQPGRTAEALEIIVHVVDGEVLDFDCRYFRTQAVRLYLQTEHRPPVFMSAFGPGAGEIAGRLADGVWTLGGPAEGTRRHGGMSPRLPGSEKTPGEIIIQGLMSWAETDQEAIESWRE
jgi:coenzyme F420-dependent glucose-6-phosphate dehydrogenase